MFSVGLPQGGALFKNYVLPPIREVRAAYEAFAPHLSEYARIVRNSANEAPTKERPTGKTIVVDEESLRIDPVFSDLPEEIRAHRPEEVGTIAALYCWREKVGRYGDNGSAYVIQCRMSVYDRRAGRLLAQQFFEGGRPPARSPNGVDQDGGRPTPDIVKAIRQLYSR